MAIASIVTNKIQSSWRLRENTGSFLFGDIPSIFSWPGICLQIWDDIISGRAEEDSSLLNRFLVISHADLKKWIFYYWFAFPGLVMSPPASTTSCRPASEVFNKTEVTYLNGPSFDSHCVYLLWTRRFLCYLENMYPPSSVTTFVILLWCPCSQFRESHELAKFRHCCTTDHFDEDFITQPS